MRPLASLLVVRMLVATIIAPLALLALVVLPAPADAAAGVLQAHSFTESSGVAALPTTPLSSAGVRVSGYPGGTTTERMTITNSSDSSREFRLWVTGITSDQGKLAYSTSVPAGSPASWVTLTPEPRTIDPASSLTVAIVLAVPAGSAAGDHAVGLHIEDLTSREVSRTPLFVEVPGATRQQIVFQRASLHGESGIPTPFSSRSARLAFSISNIGNASVHGDLTVDVQTIFGMSGAGKTFPDIVLLPGATLSGNIDVTVLPTLTVTPHARLEVPFVSPTFQNFSDAPVIEKYRLEAAGTVSYLLPVPELVIVTVITVGALASWILLRRRARRTMPGVDDSSIMEGPVAEPNRSTTDSTDTTPPSKATGG